MFLSNSTSEPDDALCHNFATILSALDFFRKLQKDISQVLSSVSYNLYICLIFLNIDLITKPYFFERDRLSNVSKWECICWISWVCVTYCLISCSGVYVEIHTCCCLQHLSCQTMDLNKAQNLLPAKTNYANHNMWDSVLCIP